VFSYNQNQLIDKFKMSVKAFELVPAIERINVMSEKATTQVEGVFYF